MSEEVNGEPTVVESVGIEAEPEVQLPSDTQTFEMPEKFAGKSAEDIAKSYMELEQYKNVNDVSEEDIDDIINDLNEEETPNEEPIKDDADASTADLITEYTERGTELTEEDYKVLEEKGYSKKQVDIYKAGVEAQRQQESLATIEKAGTTAEEASSAIEWARENWSEERITQFNSAIESSNQDVQVQMIQMLTEGYRAGNTPQADGPIHSQRAPVTASQGYESMNQLVSDMNDPRYDSRTFQYDPAYYKAVRAKAAKSSL